MKRAVQCESAQLDPFADLVRAAQLAAPGSADLAAALAATAALKMVEADLEPALDLAQGGVLAADESGHDKQRSHAHNTLGCILFQVGRSEEGQDHLDVARDIALAQGVGAELFRYYGNYSDALIGVGCYADAIELARQGRVASAERGLARTQGAFMAGNVAEAGVLAGAWDLTMTTIDEALRLEPPPTTRNTGSRSGRSSRCAGVTSPGLPTAWIGPRRLLLPGNPTAPDMMPLAVARAEVAAAEGDLAGALVTMQRAAPGRWAHSATVGRLAVRLGRGRLLLDAAAPAQPDSNQ